MSEMTSGLVERDVLEARQRLASDYAELQVAFFRQRLESDCLRMALWNHLRKSGVSQDAAIQIIKEAAQPARAPLPAPPAKDTIV